MTEEKSTRQKVTSQSCQSYMNLLYSVTKYRAVTVCSFCYCHWSRGSRLNFFDDSLYIRKLLPCAVCRSPTCCIWQLFERIGIQYCRVSTQSHPTQSHIPKQSLLFWSHENVTKWRHYSISNVFCLIQSLKKGVTACNLQGGLLKRPYFWLFIRPLFYGVSEMAGYKTSLSSQFPSDCL